jgi:hypothetical protein
MQCRNASGSATDALHRQAEAWPTSLKPEGLHPMSRISALFVAALIPLAFAACNRTEAPPVVVSVPGPAGPTGATGATGSTGTEGATGATGKTGGSTTVIVVPPAASSPSN